MFYITMNNSHILHIPEWISRTAAIKKIKEELSHTSSVVIIDLVDVTFPLHRDFFLVLSKKFPKDSYILRLKQEKTALLARSLWIQAEVIGLNAEFERKYAKSGNFATHNMSMFEYFLYELRRWVSWVKFSLFERKKQEQKLPYYKKRNSQMILIILGLISSFTLLLFIFNFAISRTTVTITPEVTVAPVTANILYKIENGTGSVIDKKSFITLKKVEFPVEMTQKFSVETIDPNSALNAYGVATVYNELTIAQDLRPSTRFVAPDGSVFRTTDWVKIPASRSLNGITEMWVVEVPLVADIRDESGKIIGERGNIEQWTDLVIPGLKFNRDKIYAKAKVNFVGGANPVKRILTQEELDSFKTLLQEQLQKLARNNLDKNLQMEHEKTGKDFALLVADAIKFSDINFSIVSGQNVGDITPEIELKWRMQVVAMVMDRKATIDHLTEIFRSNLLQWTNKELAIHTDTLRISHIVSRADDDSEIKATLEMNASTTYDFENTANERTRQLKTIIAWLSEDEAIKRMKEFWQIQDLEIKNYPFWVNTIPTNIDNIEFFIRK